MDKEQTESIVITLIDIVNRLIKSNYFTNEYLKKAPDLTIVGIKFSENKKIDAMLDILLEYTILHINNFFEVLPLMHKLESKTFPNFILSKSLDSILNSIKKNEEKLEKWRHNVAHSKNQAKLYIPYYKQDKDYLETYKNIHLTSHLIVNYITNFLYNLPLDYKLGQASASMMNKDIETFPMKQWWPQMRDEEKKILESTNKKLLENGLDIIPINQIEKAYENLFFEP